jgi:hypothetical protein
VGFSHQRSIHKSFSKRFGPHGEPNRNHPNHSPNSLTRPTLPIRIRTRLLRRISPRSTTEPNPSHPLRISHALLNHGPIQTRLGNITVLKARKSQTIGIRIPVRSDLRTGAASVCEDGCQVDALVYADGECADGSGCEVGGVLWRLVEAICAVCAV